MVDNVSWEYVQQQAAQSGVTPYQYMANNNLTPAMVSGYVANNQQSAQPTSGTGNTNTTTSANDTGTLAGNPTVVPGVAQGDNQINVADYGGQLATNPSLGLQVDDPTTPNINESMYLSDRVPEATQGQIDSGTVDGSNYNIDPTGVQADTAQGTATTGNVNTASTAQGTAATGTATTGTANTANQTTGNQQAANVDVATTQDQVAQNQMQAAQGQVSNQAQVNADDIVSDLEATGSGQNALGQSLNQAAQQNFTNIIDTSNLEGKLLAEQLGEGNYTDAKATLKGQLEILQSEFTDANGDPKIPAWASATARNVQKIAAFKGMTGTAATAALSQAIMEASIPIAQQDAAFFQTLTIKNLDNRQEATINKANVLAKLEVANMDAKLAAAVNNSQAFLQMDMANLNNEQQAALINNQARIQSILEDAKSENTARLFMAESQNEMDKFYSQLEATINQFNAAQLNSMEQFNANQLNDMAQFNANQTNAMEQLNVTEANRQSQFNAAQGNEMAQFNAAQQNAMEQLNVTEANDINTFNAAMEDAREQFYATMQYNIDTANAKWRQELTTKELDQKFEAAATDVRNMVGISVEQLNQLWDRADSLLDYAWNSANNEADRKNQIALVTLQGQLQQQAADSKGWGEILGSILGAGASALFGGLF